MNIGIIKKILAMMICSVSAMGSTVATVGAAADGIDNEANRIRREINECDILIEGIGKTKDEIEIETQRRLQELKQKIKNNKETLKYFQNLLEIGDEDYGTKADVEKGCNNLKKTIDDDIKKQENISSEKKETIREIDETLNDIKKKKEDLLKRLRELFDDQVDNKNQDERQNDSEQQTTEMWKRIASGCQYDSSNQFKNLCWLFSSSNVINYFGEVDKNNQKAPIQGIENVVDNYFNSNANSDYIVNHEQAGGEAIEPYLNINGIKTCSVLNSFSFNDFGTKDETKQAMVDLVKTQISTHFNANKDPIHRKSPVLCCKNSHWISVVGYFENTGNVVIVDSSNGNQKGSNIYVQNIDDFIETNLINESQDYGFTVDMIFSSNDEEIDSKKFDVYSLDNFKQMDEVNEMIANYF